ncbi:MAG: DEAD/DEAH box helicase family protein, partial [Firmicutes bacterium]|nr:DEAD/DEAH box helicase family protein [Candidatus Caballimonas caccae]
MNLTLKNFQQKAIADLMNACRGSKKEIVLKSCTGSGKTIILTHFIDRFIKENPKTCFVWFTPGKGNLEDQSKAKMDLYIHDSQTKLLSDVLTSGFTENDTCFINWEMVTNKKNNAVQDSEHKNLMDRIRTAQLDGLHFYIIVDEQHFNNTYKANEIISLFKADKIIRASATPQNYGNANLIEIDEEDVIAEGLIKKAIYINEGIPQDTKIEDEEEYLLDLAIAKYNKLVAEYKKENSKVNPLIVIQLPNKSEVKQAKIEQILEKKGITYLNKKLAVWLSDQKENIEEIDKLDAEPIAIIIKQAVALGWDCPRAQILVKMRDNMSETFEIQTIGRIRRMPEAKHYENSLLDVCYIYTLDPKFIEYAKKESGAYEVKTIFLKPEYKNIKLVKELKSVNYVENDPVSILKIAYDFFLEKYHLTQNTTTNKTAFETYGEQYDFREDILYSAIQGKMIVTDNQDDIQKVGLSRQLNTHDDGRVFHHCVGAIADSAGLKYDSMIIIIRRLFDETVPYSNKLLKLSTRNIYSFVINNFDKLKADFKEASTKGSQQVISTTQKNTVDFKLPQEMVIRYNPDSYKECKRNVYEGYLLSREGKSEVELEFEKWAEKHTDWFYKNGDKGNEYFSILYTNDFGKQKLFYPDYLISVKGELWIIETKGGETRTGASADIDDFSPRKFDALKNYLSENKLKGGFVVLDESGIDQDLYIT